MSTDALRSQLAEVLPDRPFSIKLWDGTEVPATVPEGPVFTAKSPLALAHLLRSPGQLGLGRAYVAGALEVDDIDKVLGLLDDFSAPPIDAKAKAKLMAAAVKADLRVALRQVDLQEVVAVVAVVVEWEWVAHAPSLSMVPRPPANRDQQSLHARQPGPKPARHWNSFRRQLLVEMEMRSPALTRTK